MGNKFKVGDMIKCTDFYGESGRFLKTFKINKFKIKSIYGNLIVLEGISAQEFYYYRFKLIKEKPLDQAVRKVDARLKSNLTNGVYVDETTLPSVGIPKKQLNPSLYCDCEDPTIKKQTTALSSIMDNDNTFNYCTTCKKERT